MGVDINRQSRGSAEHCVGGDCSLDSVMTGILSLYVFFKQAIASELLS